MNLDGLYSTPCSHVRIPKLISFPKTCLQRLDIGYFKSVVLRATDQSKAATLAHSRTTLQTEDREFLWSQWLEGECIRKGFGKSGFKPPNLSIMTRQRQERLGQYELLLLNCGDRPPGLIRVTKTKKCMIVAARLNLSNLSS